MSRSSIEQVYGSIKESFDKAIEGVERGPSKPEKKKSKDVGRERFAENLIRLILLKSGIGEIADALEKVEAKGIDEKNASLLQSSLEKAINKFSRKKEEASLNKDKVLGLVRKKEYGKAAEELKSYVRQEKKNRQDSGKELFEDDDEERRIFAFVKRFEKKGKRWSDVEEEVNEELGEKVVEETVELRRKKKEIDEGEARMLKKRISGEIVDKEGDEVGSVVEKEDVELGEVDLDDLDDFKEMSAGERRNIEEVKDWLENDREIDLRKLLEEAGEEFELKRIRVTSVLNKLEEKGVLTAKQQELHDKLMRLERGFEATLREKWEEEAEMFSRRTASHVKEEAFPGIGEVEGMKQLQEIFRGRKGMGRTSVETLRKEVGEDLIDEEGFWVGGQSGGPEEVKQVFFDEAMRSMRGVVQSLSEENLRNLPFSEKGRIFTSLMEIEARDVNLTEAKELAWQLLYSTYTMNKMYETASADPGAFFGMFKEFLGAEEPGDNLLSKLVEYRETMKTKEGEDVVDMDMLDFMTFAETIVNESHLLSEEVEGRESKYSGIRTWLLNISSLDSPDNYGGRGTEEAERSMFREFMLQRLVFLYNQGEISSEKLEKKKAMVQDDEAFDYLFQTYGSYYSKMLKTIMAGMLRPGERVAVNREVKGGQFKFADAFPGGELVYKFSPQLWKFMIRYMPDARFAPWLEKEGVDLGMVSFISYAGKDELFRHFLTEEGAEGQFFERKKFFDWLDKSGVNVGEISRKLGIEEKNQTKEKVYEGAVGQFEGFFKDVIYDLKEEGDGSIHKNDKIRPIWEIREKGVEKFESLLEKSKDKKLKEEKKPFRFWEHLDYEKFEERFGVKILGENKEEKFRYLLENFGYKFMDSEGLVSKRVGDFFGKYAPDNYKKVYVAAQAAARHPSRESVLEFAGAIAEFSEGDRPVMEIYREISDLINKRSLAGINLPETGGSSNWENVKEKGEKHEVKFGKKEGVLRGLIPGEPSRMSLYEYFYGVREPMYMRKWGIEDAKVRGLVSMDNYKKLKREYLADAYLGRKRKIFGIESRFWNIPIMLYTLPRGWWVDRWQLDAYDFRKWLIEGTEESLKKLLEHMES